VGPGRLYVVATPIGNLEDMTLRGLRILREADRIAAEDTRRAARLLRRYGITSPVTSYHDFSGPVKRRRLLDRIAEGEEVALISDAGTPAISDPGYRLITEALERGIPVTAVPGPSVLAAALSVSGLEDARFVFGGFPPAKSGQLRRFFEELATCRLPIVLYLPPHRLERTLACAAGVLGDRPCLLFRELSKRYEEVTAGTLGRLAEAGLEVRGEMVLLILPGDGEPVDEEAIATRLRWYRRHTDLPLKEAAARIARELGVPRKQVYQKGLALDRES